MISLVILFICLRFIWIFFDKLAEKYFTWVSIIWEVVVLGSTPSSGKSAFQWSSEKTSNQVGRQREVDLRIKVDPPKLVETVSDAGEALVRIPAARKSLEGEQKWSDRKRLFRFLRQKSEDRFGAEIRNQEQDLASVGQDRWWSRICQAEKM